MSSELRVLIVEDEPISREILADLLKMAGYKVVSAASGEQALLMLMRDRGRFDCLFTVVELAGLVDGWMLAEEFRGADPARPVVFASKNAAEIRPPGCAVVLSRPTLPPMVVEAVNAVTGRAEAMLQSRRFQPRMIAESVPPKASTKSPSVSRTSAFRAAS